MSFKWIKDRSKLIRKRPTHRFKIWRNYLFNRKEKRPVFIIASRRTGSNLLLSYLNSIPGVSFLPEILNKDMFYGLRDKYICKQTVLNHIRYSINSAEHAICGVKLIKPQMIAHHLILEDIYRLFPQSRFIFLYRQSLSDQFISLKIAEITKIWSWQENFNLPENFHVDLKEFENFCLGIKSFYAREMAYPWVRSRSIILNYEEMAQHPQKMFDKKIFPFLGIDKTIIHSDMKKQITRKPSQIIKNYEDFENFIKKHPYLTQLHF